MKKAAFGAFFSILMQVGALFATPTGLFWSPCNTTVQDTGHVNVDVDNYFTVFNTRGHGQSLPPDVGMAFGLYSLGDLKLEAGFDYLGGTDDPLYFNGKVGMAENKLFAMAPAFTLGVFAWGTRTHGPGRTNQNIANINLSRSLPDFIGGTLYVGAYSGSKAMGSDRQGIMVGVSRPFYAAQEANGMKYHKWKFVADYVTGKNTIGGGGFGIMYYFTHDISIETGPTWFTTRKYNGRWKFTVQLDIGFNMF